MRLDDVRKFRLYTTDGKDVWQVLHWCEEPTVTLRNLETGEKRGGAVSSMLMAPFRPLVPEDERKPPHFTTPSA